MQDFVCSLTFSKKIYHSVSYITHRKVYITALLCKVISLRIGHIPMANTRRCGLLLILFQIDKQDGDICRADAGNAACLTDGHRADL